MFLSFDSKFVDVKVGAASLPISKLPGKFAYLFNLMYWIPLFERCLFYDLKSEWQITDLVYVSLLYF
jgi:hypothetical protein